MIVILVILMIAAMYDNYDKVITCEKVANDLE